MLIPISLSTKQEDDRTFINAGMFLSICIFLYRTGQRVDPNELRRQRQRERYALNKDEINRKRREARQLKTDKAANLDRKPTPSITPVGISPGMFILPYASYNLEFQNRDDAPLRNMMNSSCQRFKLLMMQLGNQL